MGLQRQGTLGWAGLNLYISLTIRNKPSDLLETMFQRQSLHSGECGANTKVQNDSSVNCRCLGFVQRNRMLCGMMYLPICTIDMPGNLKKDERTH